MARTKIDNEKIIEMNELYVKIGTYSGVAREVGCAPSTVKKYIVEGYVPQEQIEIKKFDPNDLPELSTEGFDDVEDFGSLCVLTEEEKKEIEELWKELQI